MKVWSLLLALFAGAAFAFDLSVTAQVSASQVFIGDVFSYKVEVEVPAGAGVDLPKFVGNLGSFEVLDMNTEVSKAGAGRERHVWSATLNTFIGGDFALAPQEVVAAFDGDSAFTMTDPVPVKVLQRTEESEVDILEAEDPVELPGTPWYVVLLIVLAVLLVGGLAYLAFRNWKRGGAVRELPPYEEAVLALSELKTRNLAAADQAAFFEQLGFIVRRYVERRFEHPILDATDSELKARMSQVKGLQEAFKMGVVNLAEESAPVKFARFKLEDARLEFWTDFAARLFEDTKPAPEEEREKERAKKEAAGGKAGKAEKAGKESVKPAKESAKPEATGKLGAEEERALNASIRELKASKNLDGAATADAHGVNASGQKAGEAAPDRNEVLEGVLAELKAARKDKEA